MNENKRNQERKKAKQTNQLECAKVMFFFLMRQNTINKTKQNKTKKALEILIKTLTGCAFFLFQVALS